MEFPEAPLRSSLVDPRLYNNSTNTVQISSLKIDEDNDRQIIDQWLLDKGKFQLNYLVPTKAPQLSLNGAKLALKNCLEIVTKLNETQEMLKLNFETMSSNEWKEHTSEIGALKERFEKGMSVFEDNTILKSLKGSIVKRAKKRRNLKKQKLIEAQLKEDRLKKSLEINKSIDKWLDNKKEEVERVKMEEKMKKDADCVLDEVTKKKSEARKQLSLITALVKLRTVRDSMATQRGEKLSLEDRQAFGAVTEKLIRMWENSYQGYCKEEQCLRIMLEHNASKDTKAAINAKQAKIVAEWEQVLFGTGVAQATNPIFWALTAADRDVESFVAIRKSWDTFLSGKSGSTAIPIGWVVPPEKPVNLQWTDFLQH